MKVAFATTDGNTIDEHFGRAGRFSVFELTSGGYRFLETRIFSDGEVRAVTSTKGEGQAHEDAVQSKVEKLADCRLVYVIEIGGPSAARLVRKGIMPMKVKEAGPIGSEMEKLLALAKSSPPPWLKKALNA